MRRPFLRLRFVKILIVSTLIIQSWWLRAFRAIDHHGAWVEHMAWWHLSNVILIDHLLSIIHYQVNVSNGRNRLVRRNFPMPLNRGLLCIFLHLLIHFRHIFDCFLVHWDNAFLIRNRGTFQNFFRFTIDAQSCINFFGFAASGP